MSQVTVKYIGPKKKIAIMSPIGCKQKSVCDKHYYFEGDKVVDMPKEEAEKLVEIDSNFEVIGGAQKAEKVAKKPGRPKKAS